MRKPQTITYTALLITVGVLLPFLTAQLQELGNLLTPMHFPVLLSGFLFGPIAGCLVGVITPCLRSVLFQMPPLFPNAIAMAFELGTYGFMTGYLYQKLANKKHGLILALLCAMIAGRVVWGLVMLILSGINNTAFTWSIFISASLIKSIPGILLQLLILPSLVTKMQRYVNH